MGTPSDSPLADGTHVGTPAEILKSVRVMQGWHSYQSFAAAMLIPTFTYSAMEDGAVTPNKTAAHRIAAALGLPASWVWGAMERPKERMEVMLGKSTATPPEPPSPPRDSNDDGPPPREWADVGPPKPELDAQMAARIHEMGEALDDRGYYRPRDKAAGGGPLLRIMNDIPYSRGLVLWATRCLMLWTLVGLALSFYLLTDIATTLLWGFQLYD